MHTIHPTKGGKPRTQGCIFQYRSRKSRGGPLWDSKKVSSALLGVLSGANRAFLANDPVLAGTLTVALTGFGCVAHHVIPRKERRKEGRKDGRTDGRKEGHPGNFNKTGLLDTVRPAAGALIFSRSNRSIAWIVACSSFVSDDGWLAVMGGRPCQHKAGATGRRCNALSSACLRARVINCPVGAGWVKRQDDLKEILVRGGVE